MCSRRHDTQRKPYPAVGGEGKRRQLVVDKDFLSLVENVEIVRDIPVLTLIDRYIVEESESGFAEWKTQSRMTPAAKIDLTPENNLLLTPEEFGRRGQFYFGLSAFWKTQARMPPAARLI